MTKITPLFPADFTPTKALSEYFDEGYSTSFVVAPLVYNMSFERWNPTRPEYKPLEEELKIELSTTYFVKFDNNLNTAPESAYSRLDIQHRLSYGRMCCLTSYLVGGIEKFLVEAKPSAVIGIPNDKKLEKWYRRLATKIPAANYDVSLEQSNYCGEGKDSLVIRRKV